VLALRLRLRRDGLLRLGRAGGTAAAADRTRTDRDSRSEREQNAPRDCSPDPNLTPAPLPAPLAGPSVRARFLHRKEHKHMTLERPP
jgi:hypothetical protein